MKIWLVSIAALFLAACSAVPDELAVTNEQNLVSYETALTSPEQVQGQQARWGGTIAEVRNSDDGTIIEVVNFDLQNWARPVASDESQGRFRAILPEFVDPVVYEEGRLVTFVGTVGEPIEGKIDEFRYLFPTLNVTAKFLWKDEPRTSNVQIDYGSLWYRHHYFAPPYRIYYPVPVRTTPTGDSGQSGNDQ